jgi:hypothetical protein
VRWFALDSSRTECVTDRFDGVLFDAGCTAVRRAPVAVAVHRGDRPTPPRLTVWSPFQVLRSGAFDANAAHIDPICWVTSAVVGEHALVDALSSLRRRIELSSPKI